MSRQANEDGRGIHSSADSRGEGCVSILSLGTALPPYSMEQGQISEWMASAFSDRPAIARAVRSLHTHSGIEKRHSCSPEYMQPVADSRFTPGATGEVPTTAERMRIYAREAPPLGVEAARRALERFAAARAVSEEEIAGTVTHLVVVSCTGFFAPGLDYVIAQTLGLDATVSRTMIGFMGCSAAFNGLRTAHQIVQSEPDARVLVVCVELSSLHIQQSSDPAHLIAMSLFADGAGACLVGNAAPGDTGIFRLDAFRSETQSDTRSEMVWEIGDHGFVLYLSPQIPDHVADAAPAALRHLFNGDNPAFWAIHPGGRAIVDRLQTVFDLQPTQVEASRAVLRDVGNLSSATILFVLDELRRRFAEGPLQTSSPISTMDANGANGANGSTPRHAANDGIASGVAMAFGPGLVIEMARLSYIPVVGEC